MNRSPRLLLAVLLITTAAHGRAQLNGTYTIGTAGNYATFTAAVNALTTSGVSGPVVFNVFSGTYTEQLNIGAVAGASAANTITFQSLALDSMAVVLQHASQSTNTNDWTVRLSGVDYITFRKLTIQRSGNLDYGCVVDVTTGSTNFQLRNCRLLPSTATTTTQYREAVRVYVSSIGTCTVDRCSIDHGSGFSLQFCSSGSFAFTNNVATNQLVGARVYSTSCGLQITGNRITCRNAGGTRGMLLDIVSGAVQVSANRLQGANNTYFGMAMTSISGTAASPIRFENNSIIATNSNQAGISIVSGTCNYLDFFHNSICMTGGTTPDAFLMVLGTGVSNRISNNIFYSANGPGLRVSPASRVSASDNNVIRNGGIFGVYWGTTWYYDQPSLAAGSGKNLNSMFTDPLFVNITSDLHLQSTSPCLGAGQVTSTVLDDFDGEARPQPVATNPEIGADERPEQCPGMNGTYLIGPSVAADFSTFTAAISALTDCGITAPVLFEVESGTYTEQISIPAINGTSATNTITFRSQVLDSTAVVLQWPSGGVSNYTVRFNGVDNIRFEHLTMERSGAPNACNVLSMEPPGMLNDNRSVVISHCQVRTAIHVAALGALVYKPGSTTQGCDSLKVEHSLLEGGTQGILAVVGLNDRLLAQNNRFAGQSVNAINIASAQATFTLRHNAVSHTPSVYNHAILLGNSSAGCTVEGNRVENTNGTACALLGMNTALGGQNRVFNNMFKGDTYGLWTSGACNGLRIDNNSVYASAGVAMLFFASGAQTIASMRNNVFHGFSYALQRDAGVTLTLNSTSHNALYSSTGDAALWNGSALAGIPALQAASGQFANSFESDPLYFDRSTADLHAYAMELDAAGTPIAAVTDDFDGDARDPSTPDIGADEFTPQLWNETLNTCALADVIVSIGSGADQWIYKDRKVVARLNDNGRVLGNVGLQLYVNSGPVRTSDMGQRYLDRNWRLATQNTWSGNIFLRLFFSGNEFTAYAAADPLVTTLADAGLTQYIGVNENCLETDNPGGQTWLSYYPVLSGSEPRITAAGGTSWATAVLEEDGEVYMSGQGQVLPVELLSFTARRINELEVQLEWQTATEHNNAGFEVWRMIQGEEDFAEVGWLDGAGDSQENIAYMYMDPNATTPTSYYRLKQVDSNGAFSWSATVAVEGSGAQAQWLAYPVPAHDVLHLKGLPAATLDIQLYDASGRLVSEWGRTEVLDGLERLARGVYALSVLGADGTRTTSSVVLE